MQRLFAGLCRVISVAQFLTLVGMSGVMISLVFTRYAFSFSPSWSEEVTRYLMVWSVMLGAVVLLFFDDHITLHLLESKLGPRLNRLRVLVVRVIILGVCLVTGWTSIGFVQQMSTVRSFGLGTSMLIATLPIAIAFWLMALVVLYQIVRDIVGPRSGATSLGIRQSDYMDGSFRPADSE
ncbi:TRAP transporter small permease [Sinisalibacter aestuarii]|uniref:TRAP transporter small permease protein n=1 Tax=Sinisalibacter aestuarii TaxID=2949426 RepID=A0ABQ5LQ46_9RHOB|nr:TRAP transporter small permease [Sinisalibacter aestuarii]GKY87039.1 hypothetical protein STA1M1_09080 [Sinisalibacter aestuarii]